MILRRSMASLVGMLLLGGSLASVALAGPSETRTIDGDRLTVRNLIGEVRIEGGGGSDFEVVVETNGSDAKQGMIRIEQSGDELEIVFPSGETDYVYPAMGRNSSTNIRIDGDSWLSRLLGTNKKIRVRGSGDGLELWADVTVRVPRGGELGIEHSVGNVHASNVDGELRLSTSSGDIHTEDSRGPLSVATGSGDVDVSGVDGEQIRIATGSGDVEAERLAGDKIKIATGSGDVELDDAQAQKIQLATGSGDIEATAVGADDASIATGSGEVTLHLDRMGDGEFQVGTGSGDIRLGLPPGSSVEVHAETDGGEIAVDLDERVDYKVKEDDEVEFAVGGGAARVTLGSGSGDIVIRHR
ncbi:MAG: DUF4097 domain-containing protein [bacterium]|nr:DUF4097 domain-containing protein [bacterium]